MSRRRGMSSPTRLGLLRARRMLERVTEGADLLKRKREALVRELLEEAEPAIDARQRIARSAQLAYPHLADAVGKDGTSGVRLAAEPVPGVDVDLRVTRVWGTSVGSVAEVPKLRRTLDARGIAPGTTSGATIESAEAFEELVTVLLEAAPREMLLRQLGREVARTSRQVRVLEQRVGPALEDDVARISRVLDEREREDRVRLRHLLRRMPGGRRRSLHPGGAPP